MSWVFTMCFAMHLENMYKEHCVQGHAKKGEYFLSNPPFSVWKKEVSGKYVSSRIFSPFSKNL